ncbi:hypothetical protein ILUMI_24608, partial [Ignelater luminosus]
CQINHLPVIIMKLKLLFLLLVLVIVKTNGAKILAIFNFPSKSHHILGSTLLKALADRGHQVTMISPYPLKSPFKNYEDIDISEEMLRYKEEGSLMKQITETNNSSFIENLRVLKDLITNTHHLFFNHPAVKNLIQTRRKFDLIIICSVWNEAFLGLSHYLGSSTIVFSAAGSSIRTNGLTQNPTPYSYVPHLYLSFPSEMTFSQRVGNTLGYLFYSIYSTTYLEPEQERLRNLYLPEAPPLRQLVANVSLVLLNSHFSIESTRPYVPNMIQIGGFHVQKPGELSKELKEFMDSSKDGVIFFSLGSNLRSSDLPNDKLEAILNCFKKLSIKVLWKFENDGMPNLPPNVKISKWLPQKDILAHPNLKLFITHGGLLSTTEAVYHGVPMVGMPVYGDQRTNIADSVINGYAVQVSFFELTEKTLTEAINEVLNNPKYRQNVKLRSAVLRDQAINPLEKAIFWVEYVIRHKGAHHLKTAALKLEWYQYYLLDVIGFLFTIILLIFLSCYLLIRKLLNFIRNVICRKTDEKKKTE